MKTTEQTATRKPLAHLSAMGGLILLGVLTLLLLKFKVVSFDTFFYLELFCLTCSGFLLISLSHTASIRGTLKDTQQDSESDLMVSGLTRSKEEKLNRYLAQLLSGLGRMTEIATGENEQQELAELNSTAHKLLSCLGDARELSSSTDLSNEPIRTVGLRQLLEDLAERQVSITGQARGLALSFLVNKNVPEVVRTYPGQLLHVISNLMQNAIDATQNGEIILELRSKTEDTSGAVCILEMLCTDTGSGIDPNQLILINEALNSNLSDSKVEELGLGLKTVAKIIGYFGGRVCIESEVNKGTTAKIVIPLSVVSWERKGVTLPRALKFFGKDSQVSRALVKVASYHSIFTIEVTEDLLEKRNQRVFIDAAEVLEQHDSWFSNKLCIKESVLLLNHQQLSQRKRFAALGFSKFMVMPITSGALLRNLEGLEDIPPEQEQESFKVPGNLRVLLVEDTATTRIILKDQLEEMGCHVEESEDGHQLLERLSRNERFDLILCDLTMNHLDGDKAVAGAKELCRDSLKDTLIVAMTAYAVDSQCFLEQNPYFGDVVEKPITSEILSRLLKAVMSSRPAVKVESEVIELDDLLNRSAGKAQIAAKVLNSFIATSRGALEQLLTSAKKEETLYIGKSLHTLKGLLLEIGAKAAAERLKVIEHDFETSKNLPESSRQEISSLIEVAIEQAGIVGSNLSQKSAPTKSAQ